MLHSDARIMREVKTSNNVLNIFEALKEGHKYYEVTKTHLRKYALNRLELERNGVLISNRLESWLGTEKEMVDALVLHQKNLTVLINELEKFSPQKLKTLSPLDRLEFQRIQALVKHEVEAGEFSIDTPKPKTTYENGRLHGQKDGQNNKNRNYRPTLLKALISEKYRMDYIRGYNDGYRDGRREFRQVELKMTKPVSTRYPSQER